MKYRYVGPVMAFDRVVSHNWTGETCAASEKKARSNLAFQFKKRANLIPGSKIILPGSISVIE